MSVLLPPKNKAVHDLSLLTIACGVAVAGAIQSCCALEARLKWVNDLILNGSKVGGILAETSGKAPGYIILGIGINVSLDPSLVPDELQGKIESLERVAGREIDPNSLVSAIAYHLEKNYDLLLKGETVSILDQWRKHSVTLGQHVIATIGNRMIQGIAIDITESGALLIKQDNGTIEEVNAGEVQIRRLDGAYS
jgi:BirA family biotin operon repressor/biotin-[acetyl-CoA-carboxylase] ligase